MTDEECGPDCECAVCDTLVMGGTPDDWRPTWETAQPRRCTFCRKDQVPTYRNTLGLTICAGCGSWEAPK